MGSAVVRGHVEEIFDEVAVAVDCGGNVSQEELMVLTGMVGQFGPTSAERVYTAAATNYGYTCKLLDPV
jgi:hypothetical protein